MSTHTKFNGNLLSRWKSHAESRRSRCINASRNHRLEFEGLEPRQMLAFLPDPTFGIMGEVITHPNSVANSFADVAMQSDGKIIAVGTFANNSYGVLVRYNSDGSLDYPFGLNGIAYTSFPGAYDHYNAVALQSDGKIVAVGDTYIGSNNYDMVIARYDTDGTLDTSFAGVGYSVLTNSLGTDILRDVAIQSDGKIVAAGYLNNGVGTDLAVLRFNSDGTLDTTFNGSGLVVASVGVASSSASGVQIQTDGKIVVAGGASNGSNVDVALARFNPDGSNDPTFGTSGIVMTDVAASNDSTTGLALQSDGKIVVGGYATVNAAGNCDFLAARYLNDGSLDPSFDSDGIATTDFKGIADYGNAVAVQEDGSIILAGHSYDYPQRDVVILKYAPDGSVASQYYIPDIVTQHYNDSAYALAIQGDGRLVVTGATTISGIGQMYLARYMETKPSIVGVTVPTHASLARRVQLSGLATDVNQESNTLTYEWHVSGPAGFSVSLAGANVSFIPLAEGSYTIDLQVTDEEGLTATATEQVIVENDAPVITSFEVPTHVNEGERVRLSGLATDRNQTNASLAFTWTITGPAGFSTVLTGRNVSFIAPDDGTFEATFTVTDNGGLVASLVDQIMAANIAPTITKFTVPTTGVFREPIRLVSNATDPAGVNDQLSYTWLITGPGGYRKKLHGATATWTPPAKSGSFRVKLTVDDGDGAATIRISRIAISRAQRKTRL